MYDIDGIKSQFKSVITYSQGIFNPQVDSLFAMWEKAKAPFIERFGGLIYEWPEPVEFILDPMEKKRKALEFIDVDELLEITPENLRIRKRILDPTMRKRANFNRG